MQQIGGLLAGICFAAALGGIVRLLSPSGSSERMLRLLVTLFILASAAVPIGNAVQTIRIRPVQVPEDIAVSAVLQNAQTALEQAARRVLDAHGCADAGIVVDVQAQNGVIHARRFKITGVTGETAQEIADEIYALTGELPQITAAPAASEGR